VKQGQVTEASENRAREQRFAAAKNDQQRMLNEAEAERTREEQRSAKLEDQFEENELLVADKQEQLKERLGALTELFGHLTAASGDLKVQPRCLPGVGAVPEPRRVPGWADRQDEHLRSPAEHRGNRARLVRDAARDHRDRPRRILQHGSGHGLR
jgi:hypothetical protein